MRATIILGVILLQLQAPNTSAQTEKDTLRFVDMHVHPTMKSYLKNVDHPDQASVPGFVEKHRDNNWELTKPPPRNKKKLFSSATGYEQATYNVLNQFFVDNEKQYHRASILCASFTPIEKKFVSSERLEFFKIFGFKARLLRLKKINHWWVSQLPMNRIDVLADKNNTSFDEFMAEYKFLVAQRTQIVKNNVPYKIIPARDNAHLREILTSNNTAIVLTIEGGHTLLSKYSLEDNIHKSSFQEGDFRGYISDIGDHDEDTIKIDGVDVDRREIQGILSNIDEIKKLPHRIFFVTLAHMAWNKIIGQAKSLDMKGIKRSAIAGITAVSLTGPIVLNKHAEGFFNQVENEDGKVVSNIGIGKDVAIKLLDKTNNVHEKRIFIDIKHMDIQSRFDYYRLLDSLRNSDDPKFKGERIPIIASHVAVSGKDSIEAMIYGLSPHADRYKEVMSHRKARSVYRKQKYRRENDAILPSAEAILEKTKFFYPWSINLCNQEIKYIFKSDGLIGVTIESRVIGEGRPGYKDKRLNKGLRAFLASSLHLKGDDLDVALSEFRSVEPLMRNFFHLIKYSGRNDISGWNHLSIGSDYDGVIVPMDVAPRLTDVPVLYSRLVKYLSVFAEYTNQNSLLFGGDPTQLMKRVFYKNGEDFILKFF